MSSETPARYASSVAYGLLPVAIASVLGDAQAGFFLGVCNLFQAFVIEPIAGAFADRWGSRNAVRVGLMLLIMSGVWWLYVPAESFWSLVVFSLLYFVMYGFCFFSESYYLRMAAKKEGGFVFGLGEDFFAISRFLATVTLPYLVVTRNFHLAAWFLIIAGCINGFGALIVPNDLTRVAKKYRSLHTYFLNPFTTIARSIGFIRRNSWYPLMAVASSFFEGFFYGSIWFVFPLHMAAMGFGSPEEGLQLGIYEIVTIFLSAYTGYLADKYNWRHIHSFGWMLIAVGVVLLPFSAYPFWLVVVGFIIGVGNNLFAGAAQHALEYYDAHHEADGAFVALKHMSNDFGYGVSPVIAGILYAHYGFRASLIAVTFVCLTLALSMIALTWRTENT